MRIVQGFGALTFIGIGALIAVNGMFLQPGSHPAPLGGAQALKPIKSARVEIKPIRPSRVKKHRKVAVAPVRPKPKPAPGVQLDRAALQARLTRAVGNKPAPKVRPLPVSSPAPKTSKTTIRLIQMGLDELGYSPGPIDGSLGEQTKVAIRQFEVHRDLPVTGRVSARLIKELRKVTGTSVLSVL